MKESILNALETEQQLHNMVEGLKKEVVQEVRTTSPLDGVKPIEGTSLRCAMVSSSAIFASKGLVLAADYWVNPKFCVNSIWGANRAKFIQGGSRGIRLPPCQQHNAGGVGCQGRRSCSACP